MLARRDALRRTRQRPDGRGQRADRHQAGRRTRGDAAGALRGAPERPPPGAATAWPAPFLALAWRKVVENTRTRLDLRLQHRSGRRPGPRPVRRGGADRRGTRAPRGRRDCRLGAPRCRGRRQPVADCRGRGSSRPSCRCPRSGRRWRSSCRTERRVATQELAPQGADPVRRVAARRTRSTTCSAASTVERCSTTHGTATGSTAER